MKFTLTRPGEVIPIAVQISLPFCLHIQNGTYLVNIDGVPVEVETRKRWRNSQDCSDDDDVSDVRKYFPQGHLISGMIGGDAAEAQQIVGKNVEFAGDRNGYFRYTEAVVGLTHPANDQPTTQDIAEWAVAAVNRLVDAYRYATGAAYIPRLRVGDLRYIQVLQPLTGEIDYNMLFENGLTIATINESSEVHNKVREIAARAEPVPIHADLVLAASRALWENDYRLAVVEAVAALDVFLTATLEEELVDSGSIPRELALCERTLRYSLVYGTARALGARTRPNRPAIRKIATMNGSI